MIAIESVLSKIEYQNTAFVVVTFVRQFFVDSMSFNGLTIWGKEKEKTKEAK